MAQEFLSANEFQKELKTSRKRPSSGPHIDDTEALSKAVSKHQKKKMDQAKKTKAVEAAQGPPFPVTPQPMVHQNALDDNEIAEFLDDLAKIPPEEFFGPPEPPKETKKAPILETPKAPQPPSKKTKTMEEVKPQIKQASAPRNGRPLPHLQRLVRPFTSEKIKVLFENFETLHEKPYLKIHLFCV